MVIETSEGSGIIKGLDTSNTTLFSLGFSMDGDEFWPNSSNMSLFSRDAANPLSKYVKMHYQYGRLSFKSFGSPSYIGEDYGYITSRNIKVSKSSSSKENIFEVNVDGSINGYSPNGVPNGQDFLKVTLKGLPLSTTSMPVNTVWVDSNGFLKIVK